MFPRYEPARETLVQVVKEEQLLYAVGLSNESLIQCPILTVGRVNNIGLKKSITERLGQALIYYLLN